jgi:hypothetical protein
MASVIDKTTVKLGRRIRVWNDNRPKFSNAKKLYEAIQVEDWNGENEECLLFTQKEIEGARYRASRNKEDLTKKDFFTDLLD